MNTLWGPQSGTYSGQRTAKLASCRCLGQQHTGAGISATGMRGRPHRHQGRCGSRLRSLARYCLLPPLGPLLLTSQLRPPFDMQLMGVPDVGGHPYLDKQISRGIDLLALAYKASRTQENVAVHDVQDSIPFERH